MTPISIRPALPADLEQVLALYHGVVAHMRAGGLMQWDDSYPNREVLQKDIENGHLYLLTQEDSLYGALAVNDACDDDYALGRWSVPDGRFRAIHRLCIHPSMQGKGLATQAIAFAEQLAKDANCVCMRLDTFSENRAALALYDGLGYARVGEMHWPLGTYILFEKVF